MSNAKKSTNKLWTPQVLVYVEELGGSKVVRRNLMIEVIQGMITDRQDMTKVHRQEQCAEKP